MNSPNSFGLFVRLGRMQKCAFLFSTLEDHMPPLPVKKDIMGFYVFCHPNGRFSTAVTVNGRRYYARDYKGFSGVNVPDNMTPIELTDSEFSAAMGWVN